MSEQQTYERKIKVHSPSNSFFCLFWHQMTPDTNIWLFSIYMFTLSVVPRGFIKAFKLKIAPAAPADDLYKCRTNELKMSQNKAEWNCKCAVWVNHYSSHLRLPVWPVSITSSPKPVSRADIRPIRALWHRSQSRLHRTFVTAYLFYTWIHTLERTQPATIATISPTLSPLYDSHPN